MVSDLYHLINMVCLIGLETPLVSVIGYKHKQISSTGLQAQIFPLSDPNQFKPTNQPGFSDLFLNP